MSIRNPDSLAFAIGAQRGGLALTELYIFDRDLIEAYDQNGLIPIDATKTVGLPEKLRVTNVGRGAYFGSAEAARKAMTAVGMIEAPVAVMPEGLFYADRFGSGGIRPQERLLHFWRDDKLFFIGRYPSEEDRYLGQMDLPENVKPHFPGFNGMDGVACVQDPAVISAWLEKAGKIPIAE